MLRRPLRGLLAMTGRNPAPARLSPLLQPAVRLRLPPPEALDFFGRLAQLVRARASHARGRGFKSLIAHEPEATAPPSATDARGALFFGLGGGGGVVRRHEHLNETSRAPRQPRGATDQRELARQSAVHDPAAPGHHGTRHSHRCLRCPRWTPSVNHPSAPSAPSVDRARRPGGDGENRDIHEILEEPAPRSVLGRAADGRHWLTGW